MEYRFYTGSYAKTQEESISRYRVDFEAKTFVKELSCQSLDWPSYVLTHPNGKILYACRELTAEGAVHAMEISGDTLLHRGTWETGGNDPCNLCLDDEGKFLFVANYSGGNVSVFSLDDEGIPTAMTEDRRHVGSGPRTDRQASAHPHCVYYREGILFVCDLGCDCVYRYALDKSNGTLTELGRIALPAGAGARHMVFHPMHPELLYVMGELSSTIYLFRLEGEEAQLLQSVCALPDEFDGNNIAAAIKFSEDGKFLFTSNRGHDSICVCRVADNGRLTVVQQHPCLGEHPRDFTVFGNYLLVANQKSDRIDCLRFDPDNGCLQPWPMQLETIAPTHILKLED